MSSGLPIFFSGWRCALASFFSALLSNGPESGVSVIEGAIQLTLTLGANSAARALAPLIKH